MSNHVSARTFFVVLDHVTSTEGIEHKDAFDHLRELAESDNDEVKEKFAALCESAKEFAKSNKVPGKRGRQMGPEMVAKIASFGHTVTSLEKLDPKDKQKILTAARGAVAADKIVAASKANDVAASATTDSE